MRKVRETRRPSPKISQQMSYALVLGKDGGFATQGGGEKKTVANEAGENRASRRPHKVEEN